MKSPVVSVIIPTYNRAHLIARAIDSVLKQTFKDFELIIVDDGSVDDTEDQVRKINDSRIRFIKRDKNGGQNAALNTGIDTTKGSFVAFLDSDDEWLPEFLEKCEKKFKEKPVSGAVYTWAGFRDKDGKIQPAVAFHIEGKVYAEALRQGFLSHMITIVVRKEILEKSGGFDLSFTSSQDDDFCLRVAKLCEIGLVREPLAIIHQSEGQVSHNARAYSVGWWKLFHKFKKDILSYCGAKDYSNHMVNCFRWFLLAHDPKGSFASAFSTVLYWPPNSLKLIKIFLSMAGASLLARK